MSKLLTPEQYKAAQMLVEHKFADNAFRAAAIVEGLKLDTLQDEAVQLARALLYRDWRNSGIYGKRTAPCFEDAINGRAVPIASPLFEDVDSNAILKDLGFDG